jgi:ribosomal protein L11 methyltransferase
VNWLQLNLKVSKDNADIWSDALTDAGAVAITMEKADDQRIFELSPDHKPMWQHINLLALFHADLNPLEIQEQLSSQIDFTLANWQIIVEDDWINKWHDYAQPMSFANNLWVCPSWCAIPDPTANNIILDPEMAFGTGSHATTALCLDWISRNTVPGSSVIDYGCGSGILGIAAAKLGAAIVYAVDIDPIALDVSNSNAIKNNIDLNMFSTYLPQQLPALKVDLVIANILANPLVELAPTLAALLKKQGQIILSGILQEQAELIISRYAQWFSGFEVTEQDGWVRISAILSQSTDI